jgi:hypothetical protein
LATPSENQNIDFWGFLFYVSSCLAIENLQNHPFFFIKENFSKKKGVLTARFNQNEKKTSYFKSLQSPEVINKKKKKKSLHSLPVSK